MHRATLLLLLLTSVPLCACAKAAGAASHASNAEPHAREVITAYCTAIRQNDAAAYALLASPNLRALVDEHSMKRDDSYWCIDAIMKHPLRTITTPHAVAYLGWVHESGEDWLYPVLVGEGTSLQSYGRSPHAAPATTTWQVSILCSREWALAESRDRWDKAIIEKKLAQMDEHLLTAYLFEGNHDAQTAIQEKFQLHPGDAARYR